MGTSEETNTSWKKAIAEAIMRSKRPLFTVTIKCPCVGCVFSFFLSHFSGNDAAWNVLHGILSWFYVAYRLAEYTSRVIQ